MDTQSLRKLVERSVRGLHSAETQILAALPAMIHTASNDSLQRALEGRYLLTQDHRRRLEALAPELRIELNGVPCYGIAGILREEIATIQGMREGAARDLAIIACVAKIEHYEIASYVTASSYARLLGERDIAELLARILSDERQADRKLTEIAEGVSEAVVEA